jgi:DNA polymerase-3 subunit alpha
MKMLKIGNKDFTHIHNHTEYSAFDGLNKISSFPMEARKMGFRALGITDHGTVGGLIKFFNECQKTTDKDGNKLELAPIVPLLGCEFYLAKNRFAKTKQEQPDGRKGNRHILLIAKNWKGYQNLCRLSEASWVDGFYNDPRIDFELLEKHHDGLICSTACLSSVVNANLLYGRYDVARKTVKKFKDLFGEDFYLEVMFHGIDAERLIIPDIIKLGDEMDVSLVCSNDCHYCKQEHGPSQELMMCMSTSRCMKDPKHLHFPYHEFYLKSAMEMASMFSSIPDALFNTNEIVDKIDIASIKNNFGGMKLPDFPLPDGYSDPHKYLEDIAWSGLRKINLSDSASHIGRLRLELEDVKIAKLNNGYDFATYFLIVRDYINFAKSNGIMTGCGRGSGFGSLLLKCIGITYGVDPLEHDLLWERFLGFDSKRFVRFEDFSSNVS